MATAILSDAIIFGHQETKDSAKGYKRLNKETILQKCRKRENEVQMASNEPVESQMKKRSGFATSA